MVSSVVLCYEPFMDENQDDNYSSHHWFCWGRVLTYVDHILQEKATYWSLSTLPGISFLRRASHPTHTAPPACSFVSCHLAPHEINKIASISRVAGFKSDASWDLQRPRGLDKFLHFHARQSRNGCPIPLSVFDRWSGFRLLQLALSDTDELPLSFYLGSVSFAKQIHSLSSCGDGVPAPFLGQKFRWSSDILKAHCNVALSQMAIPSKVCSSNILGLRDVRNRIHISSWFLLLSSEPPGK